MRLRSCPPWKTNRMASHHLADLQVPMASAACSRVAQMHGQKWAELREHALENPLVEGPRFSEWQEISVDTQPPPAVISRRAPEVLAERMRRSFLPYNVPPGRRRIRY